MNLTNPMKVALAIVIIILIGLGFYLMKYSAKISTLNEKKKAYEDKIEQKKRTEALVKDFNKIEIDKTTAKKELDEAVRNLVGEETVEDFVPSYLTEIERLVREERSRMNDQSFDLQSISPGAMAGTETETTKAGGKEGTKPVATEAPKTPAALAQYPTIVFQMTLKGRYATLIDFLQQLGHLKLKKLVTINRLQLTPTGSAAKVSPVLTITLPVTAYVRQGGGIR